MSKTVRIVGSTPAGGGALNVHTDEHGWHLHWPDPRRFVVVSRGLFFVDNDGVLHVEGWHLAARPPAEDT